MGSSTDGPGHPVRSLCARFSPLAFGLFCVDFFPGPRQVPGVHRLPSPASHAPPHVFRPQDTDVAFSPLASRARTRPRTHPRAHACARERPALPSAGDCGRLRLLTRSPRMASRTHQALPGAPLSPSPPASPMASSAAFHPVTCPLSSRFRWNRSLPYLLLPLLPRLVSHCAHPSRSRRRAARKRHLGRLCVFALFPLPFSVPVFFSSLSPAKPHTCFSHVRPRGRFFFPLPFCPRYSPSSTVLVCSAASFPPPPAPPALFLLCCSLRSLIGRCLSFHRCRPPPAAPRVLFSPFATSSTITIYACLRLAFSPSPLLRVSAPPFRPLALPRSFFFPLTPISCIVAFPFPPPASPPPVSPSLFCCVLSNAAGRTEPGAWRRAAMRIPRPLYQLSLCPGVQGAPCATFRVHSLFIRDAPSPEPAPALASFAKPCNLLPPLALFPSLFRFYPSPLPARLRDCRAPKVSFSPFCDVLPRVFSNDL